MVMAAWHRLLSLSAATAAVECARPAGPFTKAAYLAAAKCPRLGWYVRRRQHMPPPSAQQEHLAEQGQRFEAYVLGRALPAVHSVELPSTLTGREAAMETAERVWDAEQARHADGTVSTAIAQATFSIDDCIVRADAVLLPPLGEGGAGHPHRAHEALDAPKRASIDGEHGWDVVEVKSVLASNAQAKVPDLAFTVHVARESGLPVRRAYLYAVNPEYRLETDPERLGVAGQRGATLDVAGGALAAQEGATPLYAAVDMTEEVLERISTVIAPPAPGEEAGAAEGALAVSAAAAVGSVEWAEAVTAAEEPPPVVAAVACKSCPAVDACAGAGLEHPLWELPRISQRRFEEIAEITPGLEVAALGADAERLLTAAQARFRRAVLRGDAAAVHVDARQPLAQALGKLRPPLYYLDFEAASSIVPPFPSLAPFETVLTQYSLHALRARAPGPGSGSAAPAPEGESAAMLDVLERACAHMDAHGARGPFAPDALRGASGQPSPWVLEHSEHLSEGARDCRRELLEQLLDALGSSGPIVVYSPYEATQLRKLAELFPEHRARCAEVVSRLLDLEPVVRNGVSHARMRGRSSLKVALPTLAPHVEGAYARDAIGDGGTAAVAFASLSSGELGAEAVERVRRELLEYCALDTRAMVELHRAFVRLALSEGGGPPDGGAPTRRGEAGAAAVADDSGARLTAPLSAPAIDAMLVRELKAALVSRGLPRTGNKAALAQRLKLHEGLPITADDAAGTSR